MVTSEEEEVRRGLLFGGSGFGRGVGGLKVVVAGEEERAKGYEREGWRGSRRARLGWGNG